MKILFTLDFSRTFLLIMLITHSPGAAYFSRFSLYFRFLAPQLLVMIFSLSTLKCRSLFSRLFILQDARFIFWLCSGKRFICKFAVCQLSFRVFFLLIIFVISCFSRTIIIINSSHQHFTVLGLRQNFNFKELDAFEFQRQTK